jgi:CDP-diacylglycerol--glycerol-3-phosphate 3-phosphatidyltransferase
VTPPPGVAAARGAAEGGPTGFKDRARRLAHAVLHPVVTGLARAGVLPDHLTIAGCLISAGAALAFFEGGFRIGAGLLVVSGVCDILDGELARARGVSSTFGAFLDSTLDRLADALVLAGLAGFYCVHLLALTMDPGQVLAEVSRGMEPRTWVVLTLTAVLALIGSFLVSYTRARAEGLGLECKVGWFERPERIVLLIVAGLFGVGPVMPGALLVLTVLSFTTAAQRVAHVYRVTRGSDRGTSKEA